MSSLKTSKKLKPSGGTLKESRRTAPKRHGFKSSDSVFSTNKNNNKNNRNTAPTKHYSSQTQNRIDLDDETQLRLPDTQSTYAFMYNKSIVQGFIYQYSTICVCLCTTTKWLQVQQNTS